MPRKHEGRWFQKNTGGQASRLGNGRGQPKRGDATQQPSTNFKFEPVRFPRVGEVPPPAAAPKPAPPQRRPQPSGDTQHVRRGKKPHRGWLAQRARSERQNNPK